LIAADAILFSADAALSLIAAITAAIFSFEAFAFMPAPFQAFQLSRRHFAAFAAAAISARSLF
jgi:hypothetical protein